MFGIAFCGLKHPHVFDLLRLAKDCPDVTVTGAFEDNPEYRNAAADRFDRFYTSYWEMLSDPDVDIVAIGDEYGYRGYETALALRAGKHVLSDKPLCTQAEKLHEIARLSSEKNLCVGCMLDLRYDPALRLAAELIAADTLGEIRAVNFSGQHPLSYGVRPAWYFRSEAHGGTFNDLIIHGIDAVSYITGLTKLKPLFARSWNAFAVKEPEFRDCAQLLGKYENGAGLIADVSYSAPSGSAFRLSSYWRFSFWGDKGMIECALNRPELQLALSEREIELISAPPIADNCLSDLLLAIRGLPTRFSQQSLFSSTLTALAIQQAADNERAHE